MNNLTNKITNFLQLTAAPFLAKATILALAIKGSGSLIAAIDTVQKTALGVVVVVLLLLVAYNNKHKADEPKPKK